METGRRFRQFLIPQSTGNLLFLLMPNPKRRWVIHENIINLFVTGKLSAEGALVYTHVCEMNKDGWDDIPNKRVATDLGMTEKQVRKIANKLVKLKLIWTAK